VLLSSWSAERVNPRKQDTATVDLYLFLYLQVLSRNGC
jgi:hypothetical protein